MTDDTAGTHSISSAAWAPCTALFDKEWEAGVLLLLRQKHFLSFDALMLVSDSMNELYERRVMCIQVPHIYIYTLHKCSKLCHHNKLD